MSKSNRSHRRKQQQERRLRIRSIRRNPPDLKKFGGALIELVNELAEAQAEADAEAAHARRQAARQRRAEPSDDGDEQ